MRNLLQGLSPRTEFALVIAGAFGFYILRSFYGVLFPASGAPSLAAGLMREAAFEAVMLLVLAWFLYRRDWKGTRLGLVSHWSDALIGIGLALAVVWVIYLFWTLAVFVAPSLSQGGAGQAAASQHVSPWLAAAYVLVNPFYEELFVTGYVIAALKEKWGETWAINVSVVLRLLYHLSLGASGIVTVIPMGLAFAYWFARTNRLWPVVAAHAVIELVTLFSLMKGG